MRIAVKDWITDKVQKKTSKAAKNRMEQSQIHLKRSSYQRGMNKAFTNVTIVKKRFATIATSGDIFRRNISCLFWIATIAIIQLALQTIFIATRRSTRITCELARIELLFGLLSFWRFSKCHCSQKNHCNYNCNDFSDYNDIIAPLNKLIMSFIKLIITLFSGVQ